MAQATRERVRLRRTISNPGPAGPGTAETVDGEPVAWLYHRTATPEEGQALADRLERMREMGSGRNLVRILGAAPGPDGAWSYWEPAGVPLAARFAGLPPAAPALAIALDVLDGLAELHGRGTVHGDLRPGLVMLGPDGHARLLGYGAAGRPTPSGRLLLPDPLRDLTAAGRMFASSLRLDGVRAAGVAAVAGAIASGRYGRDVRGARAELLAAAGGLAAPAALARSRESVAGGSRHLSQAVNGVIGYHELRGATPRVPAGATPPAPAPPAPGPDRRGFPLRELAILLAVLIALALAASVYHSLRARNGAVGARSLPPAAAAGRAPVTAAPSTEQKAVEPTAAAVPEPVASDAAPAASSAPPPPAGPALAVAGAGDPSWAVGAFYRDVVAHDFAAARALWTARMQANYPPDQNIDSRFSGTTAMDVRQNRLVSTSGAQATVYVDLLETTTSGTHHWVGTWQLVRTDAGWQLDQPNLTTAP